MFKALILFAATLVLLHVAVTQAPVWEGTYTVTGDQKIYLCEREGQIYGAHWLSSDQLLSFFSANVSQAVPSEANGYVVTALKGEGMLTIIRAGNGNIELKQRYEDMSKNVNVTTTKVAGTPADLNCFFSPIPVPAHAGFWLGNSQSSQFGVGVINETVCLSSGSYVGSSYQQIEEGNPELATGSLKGKVYPNQGFYGMWQDSNNASSTGAQFYLLLSLVSRLSWTWGDNGQPEGTETFLRGAFPTTLNNQVCVENRAAVADARGQYAIYPSSTKGRIHVCRINGATYGALWESPTSVRGFLDFSNTHVYGGAGMPGRVMEIGPKESNATVRLFGNVIEVTRTVDGRVVRTQGWLTSGTQSNPDCLYDEVPDSAYQGYWTGQGTSVVGGSVATNETVCFNSKGEFLLTYEYKDNIQTTRGIVTNVKIYTNRGIIGIFDEGVKGHQVYHLDNANQRRSWYWVQGDQPTNIPDGGNDVFKKIEATEIRADGKCHRVSDPQPQTSLLPAAGSQVASSTLYVALIMVVLALLF